MTVVYTDKGKPDTEEKAKEEVLKDVEDGKKKEEKGDYVKELQGLGYNEVVELKFLSDPAAITVSSLEGTLSINNDNDEMGAGGKAAVAVSSIIFLFCGVCVIRRQKRKRNMYGFRTVDDHFDECSIILKDNSTAAPSEIQDDEEDKDYEPKAMLLVEVDDYARP